LVRVLGTSPQFWINLQTMHDLSEIAKTAAAAEIAKLKVIVEKTPTATAGREGAREQKQSAKRRSAKSDGTAIVERSSSRRRT
jgi:hypothetical protein